MNFFVRFNILVFVIGILFSISSKLRFPNLPIGVGEVLLVLSSLVSICQFLFKKNIQNTFNSQLLKSFTIFWIISFLLLFVGYFHGKIFITDHTFEYASHDAGAYLFTFITIYLFWFNNVKNELSVKYLLKYYVIVNCVFFLLLAYKVLMQETEFYGIDLTYNLIRFSGFSENPNQLAGYCITQPFLVIGILKYYKINHWKKIGLYLFLVGTLVVGFATLSDGLVLSWICGAASLLFFAYVQLGYTVKTKSFKKRLIIMLKFVLIPLMFLGASLTTAYLMSEYASDVYDAGGQGDERANRWEIGINTIKISPLFGFGPGAFSGISTGFEREEAHNTFIDWTLSTGVLGLILYLGMLYFLTKNIWKNKSLLCALIAITVYLCFGYFLRHPFYWFNLLFLVTLQRFFQNSRAGIQQS